MNSLPASLTSIGEYVFSNCCFECIALPDGLESIPKGMFHACSNLKSVHLPSALKSIGSYAFDSCSALDNVYIPEKVTSIGYCALRLVGPSGKYAARYVYFANPGLNWTGAKVFGEPGEVSYPLMRIIVDSSMKSQCQAEANALSARFLTNKEMGSRQLSFDANGAGGALATVDIPNGRGYALPICSFTNDGGDFLVTVKKSASATKIASLHDKAPLPVLWSPRDKPKGAVSKRATHNLRAVEHGGKWTNQLEAVKIYQRFCDKTWGRIGNEHRSPA